MNRKTYIGLSTKDEKVDFSIKSEKLAYSEVFPLHIGDTAKMKGKNKTFKVRVRRGRKDQKDKLW